MPHGFVNVANAALGAGGWSWRIDEAPGAGAAVSVHMQAPVPGHLWCQGASGRFLRSALSSEGEAGSPLCARGNGSSFRTGFASSHTESQRHSESERLAEADRSGGWPQGLVGTQRQRAQAPPRSLPRAGAAPRGGADQDQAGRSERSLAAAEGAGSAAAGEALRGGGGSALQQVPRRRALWGPGLHGTVTYTACAHGAGRGELEPTGSSWPMVPQF